MPSNRHGPSRWWEAIWPSTTSPLSLKEGEGERESVELEGLLDDEPYEDSRLSHSEPSTRLHQTAAHRGRLVSLLAVVCCGLVVQLIVDRSAPGWRYAKVQLASSRTAKLESLYGIGDYEGRSWMDHIESLDDRDLAPSTKRTQRFIHEWQNPPLRDCSNKTFFTPFVSAKNGRRNGLGSSIHILTFALRTAIESNAILAWDVENMGQAFVDEACTVDGVRSLDCIFEPVTSCPRSSYTTNFTFDLSLAYMEREKNDMPTVLLKYLEEDLPYPITTMAKKYWWRGQASAYLMRLSRPSLEHIRASRFNATGHYSREYELDRQTLNLSTMPWPLPSGTQSMHIRHGDKGAEMKLVPFREYVAAGERLADTNPGSYHKGSFVSSEDASVFEELKSVTSLDTHTATPNDNWIWYASHINRLNSGPFAQLDAFGNRTLTSLSWMAEFLIAMECDAFIGTRGSNWNRLIDELRCIWIDSCRGPFIEVGTDESWKNFAW